MPHRLDLDRVFRSYPGQPQMREVARCWHRSLAREASPGPLTGAYYWVPVPTAQGQITWELQEFFDGWRPSSDHAYVWRHVRDFLAWTWQRDLRSVGYCCLPRGRVSRSWIRGMDHARSRRLVVYHGGDWPRPGGCRELVRQKFKLPTDTLFAWDEHERMLPCDAASLAAELGLDVWSTRRLTIRVRQPIHLKLRS